MKDQKLTIYLKLVDFNNVEELDSLDDSWFFWYKSNKRSSHEFYLEGGLEDG